MNIDQCHDPQWGPLYIHNNTFEGNFFRGGRCVLFALVPQTNDNLEVYLLC